MNELNVTGADDLVSAAFKVSTQLERNGIRAVLSGGTCAMVYSPESNASFDLDYIAWFADRKAEFDAVLSAIGFNRYTRVYRSDQTPISLEFPDDQIVIGNDYVRFEDCAVLTSGNLTLRLLTAMDCVRDRLCGYFYYNDLGNLATAVAVAKAQSIDPESIRQWAESEGQSEKFERFVRRMT